jgi:hypothetical protein
MILLPPAPLRGDGDDSCSSSEIECSGWLDCHGPTRLCPAVRDEDREEIDALKSMPLTPPNGADPRQQAQWQELTRGNEGGAVLGWLERLMFFAAVAAGASIAVGAWLAFKVASSRAQEDRGRSRSSRSLRSSHCAPSMGLPRAHDVSDRHRLQHSGGFDRRRRRCVLAKDRPSTLPLTAHTFSRYRYPWGRCPDDFGLGLPTDSHQQARPTPTRSWPQTRRISPRFIAKF